MRYGLVGLEVTPDQGDREWRSHQPLSVLQISPSSARPSREVFPHRARLDAQRPAALGTVPSG
jgi:hypothetical protein